MSLITTYHFSADLCDHEDLQISACVIENIEYRNACADKFSVYISSKEEGEKSDLLGGGIFELSGYDAINLRDFLNKIYPPRLV